jgi:predicted nucleotidyltransferase
MRPTREQVFRILEQNRETIRGFGAKRLGLFGSCARGENPATSNDLDFVVELETSSFDAYMDLKLYLEEQFGCAVDLVMEHTIKPRLRPSIMKDLIHVPGL